MTAVVSAGWSRRQFLGGAAGAAGALALGACGPDKSGGSGVSSFTALYEGAGSSEVIDPGRGPMFIDEARIKHLFDGLYEVDSTMTPVPRLVTRGEPNADGTRWRMSLRQANWHDGAAFVAADVLYTLSRILGPQQGASPFIAATTLSQVDLKNSRAVDDRTVEIALKSPSFDFPTLLTSYGTRIVKDGTKDFTTPVGTGPFRFESFEAGRSFVARRHKGYWDGTPQIKELRILSAASEARLSALRGGQGDFADNLAPSAFRTLEKTDGISVHSTPNSGILYFAMKTDRAPFDIPDVRRAMMHMIDRDELVKVALQGKGEVSDDVFGRGYRYYANDLEPHQHDPDLTRSLLRKAGVRDLTFDLYAAPVANGFIEAAHLVADQAKKAGVTVKVRLGSKDTYYTDALQSGAMTMGQSGPLAIPYHFGSRLISDAPKNNTHWADRNFDELYRKAQRTRSQEERTRLYHRMHEILHDRGGYIFWATTPWDTAYRSGYRDTPDGVPNSLNWARFNKVRR